MSFTNDFLVGLEKQKKGIQTATPKKRKKTIYDIAPSRKKTTVASSDIAPAPKKSLFDDGYDFGDITKTILGTREAKAQETSAFDDAMHKKYSAMSFEQINKAYDDINAAEKTFKDENGGKFINYLTKAGSYLAEGKSGQSGSAIRSKSQSNIDKINDLTREKEILNIYRKQKATEYYLNGLNEEQIKLLDDISTLDAHEDFDELAPVIAAFTNTGNPAAVYSMATADERSVGESSREKLFAQLKEKNPEMSDSELDETINNMVELRKNQVNAEERKKRDEKLKNTASNSEVSSFITARGKSIIGGMMTLPELFLQRDNEYGYDTNAAGFKFANDANTIDEQIQLEHDWTIEVGGEEVDAFDLVYNVGTGIVDNLGRMVMSGGNSATSGAIMFSQGVTQSVIEGKEKGYSDSKALTLGLLNGTFEALAEKLELDVILGKDGKALRKFIKSFVAEGGEELVSNWLNRIADKVANGKHSELSKKYDNYINKGYTKPQALAEVVCSVVGEDFESFLIGGIAGGVMGGGVEVARAAYNKTSTKSERNTINTLVDEKIAEKTKQQAIENAVNKAIEERETIQGGKFTNENKKAFRESFMAQIESGEIEIDASSETLSKEDVATIKKEVKDSLKNGKIELSKIEGLLAPEETKQINELTEALNSTKDEQKKAEIQAKIKQLEGAKAETLKTQAKENKYLAKAVYEKVLGSQGFEYDGDISKITDEYEKAAIESATRHLNNTTEAKRYGKVISKLAKDRQTRYILTNNQELMEQGDLVTRDEISAEDQAKIKALEKQLANAETKQEKKSIQAQIIALKYLDTGGLVRKNVDGVETVLINVDSKQAMYSVVGHETKHLLEKYSLNKEFNKLLFDYAKAKGDLDAVKSRINDVYKTQENVDIEGEVAAELTGKYLFEDEKFLDALMKQKSDSKVREVINKIKELIDDLVVRFKGTEQEKQLREVQKKFTELYNSTDADVVENTAEKNTTQKKQYSLSDEVDFSRAYTMQAEVNELNRSIKEIEASDEFKELMNEFYADVDNGIKKYNEWKEKSGYAALIDKRNALRDELDNLRKKASEYAYNKALEEEKNAIAKSGLSEADYFRKQAVKEFGYTPYFYDAGYITPNGKMLNFSGEKGKHYGSRGQDHRAIGAIYTETSGTDALIRFMKDGNIRIMAESPGIDVSTVVEPTKEQYATIRRFIYEYIDKEYFNVDFSDESGKVIGSLEYENRINPARILNDIKHFYATGEIRGQNDIEKYRYSLSAKDDVAPVRNSLKVTPEQDAEYVDAVNRKDVDTLEKMVVEAAEKAMPNSKVRDDNGKLRMVYHGRVSEFNVFDRSFSNIEGDFGKGYYFTSNEYDVDSNYASEEGPDLVNKIARYAEKLEYEDEFADLTYEEREEIAREKLITSEPNTITAYLNMENPVYITPNEQGTFLDFNEEYDEEYDEYGEPEGLLVDFIEALNNNAADYSSWGNVDFSFLYDHAYDGGLYAADVVKIIKDNIIGELIDENGDLAVNEVIRLAFEDIGFDGIIDSSVYYKFRNMNGMDSGTTHYIVFNSNQIKEADLVTYDDNGNIIPLSERFNEGNEDIRYSLAKQDEGVDYNKSLQSIRYTGDIAPSDVVVAENTTTNLGDLPIRDDIAPMTEYEANARLNEQNEIVPLTDADVPPETDAPIYDAGDITTIDETTLKGIGQRLRETLSLTAKETKAIQDVVQKYSTTGIPDKTKIFDDIKEEFGEKRWKERADDIAEVKRTLKGFAIKVSDAIKSDITDYSDWKKRHQGRLNFSNDGLTVDDIYSGLNIAYPGLFPADIVNPTDQLLRMAEIADNDIYKTASREVDNNTIQEATDIIYDELTNYKANEAAQRFAEENAEFYKRVAEEETASESTAKTVKERNADKLKNLKAELLMNQQLRNGSQADFEKEVSRLQAEYNAKRDKNTKVANNLLRRIERMQRMKNDVDADYSKRIGDLEAQIGKMESKDFQTAEQRMTKQQGYKSWAEKLIGDTSTWVDKKLGISYKVNTLRRNLRDIVRDGKGNQDIQKADAIYDELQGRYNHNEAELKREANRIKKVFADMKITKAEDTYIQMLGELRHNPDTTLTDDVVKDFYKKHKGKIDEAKVDKIIEKARPLYDELLSRVNVVLAEQGMKEIPYRQGYFPHFTDDKQGILGKLFNWKTKNDEIPTDIAGLTEMFNPERSWQSFNKQRKGDTTDYSFMKGLDTYVQGSLDWIYHIEDIQKRRAFENHIRYVHSEQGIQERIDAIHSNEEYDADEMQEQIDLVYKEARNPLNNFVTDFRTQTNTLAGKKSSIDRGMEEMTNRKVYSTMTNLSNRVTANMVAGSVSSALTNFIPITQSWGEVSPISSVRAMADTIKSTIKDDGTINKSDFLTNRLNAPDNLYKTNWDKVGDKVGWLMDAIDSFTSQTVWRSKYLENISNGMSENEAIKNADQFAENVMAGRSRGNNPTIFDSKNPLVKTLTAFQLEVNNQYGYMFKDMPNDLRNESMGKLIKGYATMFVGAYVYNALYSSLTGRDAAFDPIGIIEDLLRDLGVGDDDEEEEIAPVDVAMNLTNNLLEEVPFVGGLLGGGRIPLNSAMPYGGITEAIEGTVKDISEGNTETLTKEWLNPVYYLAMPMGGGQVKKTIQGLKMFDDDLPISGSYTDSGNLRFPVEDTPKNKVQAAIFGQYANDNAQKYFDEGYAPLKEKQIQEFIDVDIPIADYWKYRKGLKGLDTTEDKFNYVDSLDLPLSKKNILINNLVDRKEPVNLEGYGDFESLEEFDYSVKNPGKYAVSKVAGGYDSYKAYSKALNNIEGNKDNFGQTISGSRKVKVAKYINGLDADYYTKIILYKNEYNSDHRYDYEIVTHLNSRNDLTYEEKVNILTELGFTVGADGNIGWE